MADCMEHSFARLDFFVPEVERKQNVSVRSPNIIERDRQQVGARAQPLANFYFADVSYVEDKIRYFCHV
jgi:hypothetical protein